MSADLSFASEDKNYRTYKSATQEKINSSNSDWFIIKTNRESNFLNPFSSLKTKRQKRKIKNNNYHKVAEAVGSKRWKTNYGIT